jgi:hypothetical protein
MGVEGICSEERKVIGINPTAVGNVAVYGDGRVNKVLPFAYL